MAIPDPDIKIAFMMKLLDTFQQAFAVQPDRVGEDKTLGSILDRGRKNVNGSRRTIDVTDSERDLKVLQEADSIRANKSRMTSVRSLVQKEGQLNKAIDMPKHEIPIAADGFKKLG